MGGPYGDKLARAAFAVLTKMTCNANSFLALCTKLMEKSAAVQEQDPAQKARKLAQIMKQEKNENFMGQLKLWEQASMMRKWTSKARLVVSERIEANLRKKMSEEYVLRGR